MAATHDANLLQPGETSYRAELLVRSERVGEDEKLRRARVAHRARRVGGRGRPAALASMPRRRSSSQSGRRGRDVPSWMRNLALAVTLHGQALHGLRLQQLRAAGSRSCAGSRRGSIRRRVHGVSRRVGRPLLLGLPRLQSGTARMGGEAGFLHAHQRGSEARLRDDADVRRQRREPQAAETIRIVRRGRHVQARRRSDGSRTGSTGTTTGTRTAGWSYHGSRRRILAQAYVLDSISDVYQALRSRSLLPRHRRRLRQQRQGRHARGHAQARDGSAREVSERGTGRRDALRRDDGVHPALSLLWPDGDHGHRPSLRAVLSASPPARHRAAAARVCTRRDSGDGMRRRWGCATRRSRHSRSSTIRSTSIATTWRR